MTRRAPSFRARLTALVTGTVAIAGLVICTQLTLYDARKEERVVDYQDRPSMELVLDEYRAFQRDLVVRLDERFGARTWVEPPNDPGFDGVDCGDQDFPAGASASLPSVGFDGTYPKQQWPEVRDLVIEVGNEHHFTAITMFHDDPAGGDFSGRDPRYDGTYYFGMGKNTVFGIETGCHRWDTPPAPVN